MPEADNIILHHLQGIRADIQGMRSEIRTVQSEVQGMRSEMHMRFEAVETQITGFNHLMTLLAAHYHSLDERVDILEGRP